MTENEKKYNTRRIRNNILDHSDDLEFRFVRYTGKHRINIIKPVKRDLERKGANEYLEKLGWKKMVEEGYFMLIENYNGYIIENGFGEIKDWIPESEEKNYPLIKI